MDADDLVITLKKSLPKLSRTERRKAVELVGDVVRAARFDDAAGDDYEIERCPQMCIRDRRLDARRLTVKANASSSTSPARGPSPTTGYCPCEVDVYKRQAHVHASSCRRRCARGSVYRPPRAGLRCV